MTFTPKIKIKRVYDPPEDTDGLRILVDRLWPRGLKRKDAKIHVWAKELAPSTLLRTWFGHEELKFFEFRLRYFNELDKRHDESLSVIKQIVDQPVTLLYAAHNSNYNHALILREYLLANFNSF